MKQVRLPHWFRKMLVLSLSIVLCLWLLSACDIVDMISKGTDLIDELVKSSTDAAVPTDAPFFPGFPTMATTPTAQTQPISTMPPDPTAESEPAPTFSTDPNEIRYGIVKSDSASLYDSPSQASGRIGSLNYGERVPIYIINKGWVYTPDGWTQQSNFYIEGHTGENPVGTGTVTGTDVNLRAGPGRSYDILGQHNTGDQLQILEEFFHDNLWWGFTGSGWICMDYVYVNGTASEKCGTGVVTGDVVNIRTGPGTQHEIVGTVKEGDVLQIYHYITVKGVKWCCIDRGWVCMDYIRFAHQ